jgi:PAS domain S-box-containing protein
LDFTGRTLDQEQGTGWVKGIHPDDLQSCLNTYLAAFQARQGFQMEYRLRRADRVYRWILHSGMPRFTPNKSFAGYIGSCIDITERKDMEDKLNRQAVELQWMLAELQQFARLATHDLQEPLRMVTCYVQLLAQRYHNRLDENAERWITYAVEGSKRLQRLILDLLAYHEIGTQMQKLTSVECESVLTGALTDLRGSIAERGAIVTHDPLPTVWGDASQLQVLFRNLISNGIKFHRQEPPHVHISATHTENTAVFSVRDNGVGIEPQHIERLFLVFQRLHSQEPYPKPGVGLAMCRKIVRGHGGRIWIESESGKGTTFFFTIPLQHTEG